MHRVMVFFICTSMLWLGIVFFLLFSRFNVVDIGGCTLKFFSFGDSMAPEHQVCTFVVNCYCRKFFLDERPTVSLKHYFFSSLSVSFLLVLSSSFFLFFTLTISMCQNFWIWFVLYYYLCISWYAGSFHEWFRWWFLCWKMFQWSYFGSTIASVSFSKFFCFCIHSSGVTITGLTWN